MEIAGDALICSKGVEEGIMEIEGDTSVKELCAALLLLSNVAFNEQLRNSNHVCH